MRCFIYAVTFFLICLGNHSVHAQQTRPFQPLWIPPVISGKSFDLSLNKATKSFWTGATTNTHGFNDNKFWGPTLIFEQGDTVQINVKNNLDEPTTVHWHGLHLPAATDGGPHQMIAPGATWNPSFTVKNNAATYWYHPHPHELTQKQLTMGAGGLIIVKDPIEAALPLPRTYGVDDLPLVLSSRRFYQNDQFSYEGDNDKYGDFLLVNGTLDSQVSLPSQFVRLRILNAEIERGYELGFHDNRTFYVIATDGGLVDKPIPVKRTFLMVGERVEILVNLADLKAGSHLNLMAYNRGHEFGFPGGEPDQGPPNGGYLNNRDFRILRINVAKPTEQPITKLPETLTKNQFVNDSEVTNRRTLRITGGRPTFSFDNKPFNMHVNNLVVKLGAVEAWTIVNNNIFGHSFHIHDVQFKLVNRSRDGVGPHENGWKDTVYVPRGQSITFLAKFDDFASDKDPFMYHCHMSNHEDSGMMGEFLVVRDPETRLNFRERRDHPITPAILASAEKWSDRRAPEFDVYDLTGARLKLSSLTKEKPLVLFFIDCACPCSRDAAPFLDRLAANYGDSCTIIGVTNSNAKLASTWVKTVGVKFAIVADQDHKLIKAYHAESSVTTMLVAPSGTIAKTFPGYGEEMLNDLANRIAQLANVSPRQLAFGDAPKNLVAGCPFVGR